MYKIKINILPGYLSENIFMCPLFTTTTGLETEIISIFDIAMEQLLVRLCFILSKL